MMIWLAGIASSLLLAMYAQSRYRACLRGAVVVDLPLRWPVLRATVTDVWPALTGAWRSRIVLPSDFESRYSASEQSLIAGVVDTIRVSPPQSGSSRKLIRSGDASA